MAQCIASRSSGSAVSMRKSRELKVIGRVIFVLLLLQFMRVFCVKLL